MILYDAAQGAAAMVWPACGQSRGPFLAVALMSQLIREVRTSNFPGESGPGRPVARPFPSQVFTQTCVHISASIRTCFQFCFSRAAVRLANGPAAPARPAYSGPFYALEIDLVSYHRPAVSPPPPPPPP